MPNSKGFGVRARVVRSLTGFVIFTILLSTLRFDANCRHSEAKGCNRYQAAQASGAQQGFDFSGWKPESPLDRYTLLLAAFTGGLFVATSGLWIFTGLLWRSTLRAVAGEEEAIKAALDHVRESARAATEMGNVASAMAKANELSEANLAASQRAWLRPVVAVVDVGCDPSLEFPLMVGLSIVIENLGKSPATHVRLRTDQAFFGVAGYFNWDVVAAQTALSAAAKERGDTNLESVIFPADADPRYRRIVVAKELFHEVTFGHDDAQVFPVLLGCIEYQIPFSSRTHETWFTCQVAREDHRSLSPAYLRSARLAPEDLQIQEVSRSRRFAD